MLTLSFTLHAQDKGRNAERPWCDVFSVDKTHLVDIGKNPYFILVPGQGGVERIDLPALGPFALVGHRQERHHD